MIYRLIVIVSVFVASCAQMLLKCAARRQVRPFWRQYFNVCVVGGYGLLLGALLVNVFCLGKGVLVKEVSVIESLSLLFVPSLSWLFFREPITWRKAIAMGLVMTGTVVFFLGVPSRDARTEQTSCQQQLHGIPFQSEDVSPSLMLRNEKKSQNS